MNLRSILASTSGLRFETLVAVVEKALDPPRLQFELAGGTRGLDYVAEVRRDR